MLFALLIHLEGRCVQLSEPAGRLALLEAARASSATIGREVRVEMVDRAVVGRAETIDDHGHLHVRTADGTSFEVTAGDVIHLRPTFPA
jgi:BirA family biotin operon repressor/biotin-[acetyl-CoA-carboxylase] ligase